MAQEKSGKSKNFIIAIDGTAASGKGTLARELARTLKCPYLDTGKLYRYIGYMMLEKDHDPDDEAQATAQAQALCRDLAPDRLQNPALATDEAGQAASKVARFEGVRAALLAYQKEFAQSPPEGAYGAILDGRDIGTVVCPDADVKLYITASAAIRARRRHKELQSKGFSVTYDAVLADMIERDRRDADRDAAPMKPAEDAIVLDTSKMNIQDVLMKALEHVQEKLSRKASGTG